jgi:coenzyme PQQ precursor peptide PqqA
VESPTSLSNPHIKGETPMAWKTPRIVEIAVGMEINSYACADL